MNLKQVEKATRWLQQIKELDAELLQIEKYAMQAANDDIGLRLTLDIADLTGKDEPEQADEQSVNIQLANPLGMAGIFKMYMRDAYGNVTSPMKDNPAITYKQDISNNVGLQILGLLLLDKQQKRGALINQLQKIGVTI